jgi:hypothetical protein
MTTVGTVAAPQTLGFHSATPIPVCALHLCSLDTAETTMHPRAPPGAITI